MQIHDPPTRIALITDFGDGPYVGQILLMFAAARAVAVPLISDLPPFRPDLAAYLLPALMAGMPRETAYVCVVDPGVGGARGVLAVSAAGGWLIGPDNGLLAPALRRDPAARVYRVHWRPRRMSNSFHGRDVFAPLALGLMKGELPDAVEIGADAVVGADWPDDLAKVCYVDRYGNLISGVRAARVDPTAVLAIGGHRCPRARTFSEVPVGTPFWYRNAFGLLEVAINQGRADVLLGLGPGDNLPVTLLG